MTAILDGKKLSEEIALELTKKIKKLSSKPKLAIVQVGSLPESNKYISRKVAFAEKIGALIEYKKLPESISFKKLADEITKLNQDTSIHGIIVQEPLPSHLEPKKIVKYIDEEKRVDGGEYFVPATTLGILTMLEKYNIKIAGKKVVVVGRSNLVGKPTALALIEKSATVTVCNSHTKNLKEETKRADILIVAAGKPKLITKNYVSKNQVIIDVGISVLKTGKLIGDVDFKNIAPIVRAITPVPGGIGPMTVASLFQNLLKAYRLQSK